MRRAALRAMLAMGGAAPALALGAGEFDCLIEPAQVVELRSPVVGLLEQVHARRGALIRQGQVLVTIDSRVEQSASDTAQARAAAEGTLELARHRVGATREKARRMAELLAEEFVSAQARDDAAAEARQAEAELKTASENADIARLEHRQALEQLNRRVLRSPFDGVVVDQYLYPGALVDGGDTKKPILKIAQTQPLAVQAVLPFRYFPQVKAGMSAVVTPEPPFTREIRTRVDTVDRVIDSAAGTFGVVLHLPNSKQELPGGIRCRLRLPGLL
jgi:RND family efflux transporter MFP subunit